MPLFFKSISVLALIICHNLAAAATELYPDSINERARAAVAIEMPKAYVSGILIMVRSDRETVSASLINEFGLSLLDFAYNERKNKVKLFHVIKKLDKWYIRRVLRGDLKQVMAAMRNRECSEFINQRRNIKYTFKQLNETVE